MDSLSGFHPVEYIGRAVKYYLGSNTGLVHEYVDYNVQNGIKYYYALVAYDGGSIKFGIPPSETQAVISRDPITGELKYDVNTAGVTPGPPASGIDSAQAGIGGLPTQVVGDATGKIGVLILNNSTVEDKLYKIYFPDSTVYNVLDSTGVEDKFTANDTVYVDLSRQNIEEDSFQLLDSGGNPVDTSKYFVNYEFGRIKGQNGGLPKGEVFQAKYRYYPVYKSTNIHGEDANDAFNGLRVFVLSDPLAIDYKTSGFINDNNVNLQDTLMFPPVAGAPKVKYRANWEIRWTGMDTTADGKWVNPGDTVITNLGSVKIVCPFKIVNVTENVPAEYLLFVPTGTKNLTRWNLKYAILLRPTNAKGTTTSYQVQFSLPSDSNVTPVYPKAGDVFAVNTTKPFQAGDTYLFKTQKSGFQQQEASQGLDNIYVVPNPYVAYSIAESPSNFSDARGDRQIQFRNLPPKCTIRIYTITGELVQTINKDDNTSMATWDLLSYEGERIAYGVYIYHVDAPGIGQKIGRLAIIK